MGAGRDNFRDSHVAPVGAVLIPIHAGDIADFDPATPYFRRDSDSSTAQNARQRGRSSRRRPSTSELVHDLTDGIRTKLAKQIESCTRTARGRQLSRVFDVHVFREDR